MNTNLHHVTEAACNALGACYETIQRTADAAPGSSQGDEREEAKAHATKLRGALWSLVGGDEAVAMNAYIRARAIVMVNNEAKAGA